MCVCVCVARIQTELKKMNLSKQLRFRVLDYYYYLWHNSRSVFLGQSLVGDVSSSLRRDIQLYMSKDLVQKVRGIFFGSVYGDGCVNRKLDGHSGKLVQGLQAEFC